MITITVSTTSSGLVVNAGTIVDVVNGGTLRASTVDAGGAVFVSSGGKASATTINSSGALTVSSGGSASGSIVSGGGQETVASGGIDSAAKILSGGSETVLAGGSAKAATVSSGGVEVLAGGGTLSAVVFSSGAVLIDSGIAVTTGLTLTLSAFTAATTVTESVSTTAQRAVSAVGASISGGGRVNISGGGVESGGTVAAGGTEVLYAGGTLASEMFSPGAVLIASGLAVGIGQTLSLAPFAAPTTISESGATVSLRAVSAFSGTITGAETIGSGGLDSGTKIQADGSATVLAGGTAKGDAVASGGTVTLLAGGALNADVFNSGAVLVESGLTVASGQTLRLAPFTATTTTINASTATTAFSAVSAVGAGIAGTANVSSGGVDVGASIFGGGRVNISSGGVESGGTVAAGGTELLLSGGTLANETFAPGAGLIVSSLVLGAGQTLAVAPFTATTVVTEGVSALLAISAVGVSVGSGALESVANGGFDSASKILAGGSATVLSGATGKGDTVFGGGTEVVDSGGALSGVVFSSGAVLIDSGFALSSSGQTLTLSAFTVATTETESGGTTAQRAVSAVGATVGSGARVNISSGGIESGGTVQRGGTEALYAGGTLAGETFSSGAVLIASGLAVGAGQTLSLAPFTTATIIGETGGAASRAVSAVSTTLVGGSETVFTGGTAVSTTIGSGGLLALDGGTATGAIKFSGSGGTLGISGTAAPGATISGFAAGDTIDLKSFASGATLSAGTTTLKISHGGSSLTLNFAAGTVLSGAHLMADGQGGVDVLVCFCAGTGIRTPAGDIPVEALVPDDLVTLADSSTAPVRWIGRQTVAPRFADPLLALPIRIRAGALADALPVRDLLVSPSHAILLDGALVQAGALVNGVSILREPAAALPGVFCYYHIELDRHALLLAEGVPTESFVDHVERVVFDNWAEHEALFGAMPPIAEMPLPRAKAGRQVAEATKRRLAVRSREFLTPGATDAA